jgi:serine/threonine-protein kinase RsbW
MSGTPNPHKILLDLPSRLELLGVVDRLADGITEHMEFEDVDKDAVAISVIEACTNAIQHGHHDEGAISVKLCFELQKDTLVITVHDRGAGFDLSSLSEVAPPDLLATRGRGIYIMRAMMDEVDFDFSDGTLVRLAKHRSQRTGGETPEES